MSRCRIIQLTDLHLLKDTMGELQNASPYLGLKSVLRHLSMSRIDADMLIISGDLTDDAHKQTYRQLRSMLDDIKVPIYVTLGNHDELDVMSAFLLNETIHHQGHLMTFGWNLVFIETAVEGEEYGQVNESELLRIEHILNQHPDQPSLMVMHHGPISNCAKANCQLINAEDFMSMLGQHRQVRGVISGHTHQCIEARIEGIHYMTTPSTFLKVKHPCPNGRTVDCDHCFEPNVSGYRVLDLYDDGRINTKVMWL